ncbi:hypothetical protein TMatcc_009165 [Talaromyces marneffei ATCC 18224]
MAIAFLKPSPAFQHCQINSRLSPTKAPLNLHHSDYFAAPMAPINRRNRHHCRACNNDSAPPSTQDARDADTVALKLAQDELQVVYQSVEQLLNMMRTGSAQQLEPLFAAAQSGASQDDILAVVRQYTQGVEVAQSK